MRDEERSASIRALLKDEACDVLACSLPQDVLLLSGYWPVVGTSLAVATARHGTWLVVPKDEEQLARRGWADRIITFHPSSLDCLRTPAESAVAPLQEVARAIGAVRRIALDTGESSQPSSYAAMHLYRSQLEELFAKVFPSSELSSANPMLTRLRERKSRSELEHIRAACQIAERAFVQGAAQLRPGLTEVEAANLFRVTLSDALADFPQRERIDGFVYCMSGPNSAEAFGAYARSRARRIAVGDFVLIHCNSYTDGFWTDVTRTYHIGELNREEQAMYDAVFAAREAAFHMLTPGVGGAAIDSAARRVLDQRGYGAAFKHSTGHGVGFEAINANARPRLHPKSSDTMLAGMVFNLEPAIYIEGRGGLRHCDMVALTADGCELLTSFHCGVDDLVLDR
jgi:Xaa-Pro aminopeptidase